MNEQVQKYFCGNARVFFVALSDCVQRSAALNRLDPQQTDAVGRLEAFACCIAALQKEERASVTVKASFARGEGFSATADRDGTVRGRNEECAPGGEDVMEVTLRLPLRGNYTGIVTGNGLDDLIERYFTQSLQIAAVCRVFVRDGGYYCVAAEQLPGAPGDLTSAANAACADLPGGILPDGFELLETDPLHFGCTCSRSALLRVVSALPDDDRQALSENGVIVTRCSACGKEYTFEI